MSTPLRTALALQCSIAIAGCGGSAGKPCTQDSDCASHFCKADGTCGDAVADAPPADDGATDTPSGLCTPNHDGQITAAELPLIAGRTANFRTATNVAIDTAGHANGDGSRSWDYTAQLAGDADQPVALASPTGAWWQSDFPSATYAVPLSASSDLIGVFEVGSATVTLLGIVSPSAGALQTKLTYDPPAEILALPITTGATWTSTSTVSGTAQGAVTAYTEKYSSRVDEVGTVKTPYGDFPVVRIATDLTDTEGGVTLHTKRSFAWVAECFGSVATIQGKDNDTSAELSQAAEVRRLAP
jgi:hypothetical protein